MRLRFSFLSYALFLAFKLTIAWQFKPGEDIGLRAGASIQRRTTCEAVSPNVDQSAVFTDACDQNPQNDFNTCYNQLVLYAQDSARNTCARKYIQYNACLVAHDYNETTCSDSRVGYVYCSNITVQAYAYCGCYYGLPYDIANCANVQLNIRPVETIPVASIPTSTRATSGLLSGPIAPPSATLSIPIGLGSIGLGTFVGSPPATSQSSTDARSTTFVTSTIVTSSCGSSDTNCPATTLVTSSPVVLSSWPYEGPYTTSSAVSVPWFTPVSVPSSPIPSMTTVSASSYSSIGQQTTYTRVITVPVTHTLTATTCPSNVAHCPSTGYTSESVYTTEEVRTVLSCEGGCTRAGGAEQCVVRKRSVLIPPKEEI